MTKTVHFLRHAQSAFNEVYTEGDPDPMLFDARLSDLGHEQVTNLPLRLGKRFETHDA